MHAQIVEKRYADDGKAYTREEFIGFCGEEDGKWFWSQAPPEKRFADDGKAYTLKEFISFVGEENGTWFFNNAKSAPKSSQQLARQPLFAAIEERLSSILSEHPYLDKEESHPLQPLVKQCRDFISSASIDKAECTLQELIVGLESLAESSSRRISQFSLPSGSRPPALVAQEAQFAQLLSENPYLEPGKTLHKHSLHHWVQKFRTAVDAGNEADAARQLTHIVVGLESDKKKITEAFKRFDLDGNGALDPTECQHMCAYLGWAPDDVNMMDVNADGKLTVIDFLAFVGTMGGVQRLFEQRRKRIAQSRGDVANASAGVIAVGSRVQAYFYVNGSKSTNWQEAIVLAVGVKIKPDSPKLGVLLEFGFSTDTSEKDARWNARQVVSPKWIVSSVQDAAVAAALREVGILDEQQSFWSSILPESEMREIGNLVGCQRNALAHIRKMATAAHDNALPELRERFDSMGYGELQLEAVLTWIQDLAPVVVHVHIDTVGKFMEVDDFYRNQFETKTSCGALDDGNETRIGWERDLFGEAYDDAKPFDRCKYGALGVMNDYRGVTSASQYGDSYMVLKDVRLRCTFASEDSGGIMGEHLAVLDKYAHVLMEYNDDELHGLIAVATAEDQGTPVQLLRGASEDPTSHWSTFGFPDLQRNHGCFYFEIELFKGCQSPQVGMLSSKFHLAPYQESTAGVGDDEHGWAVDGEHAARWHKGQPFPWGVSWPRQGNGEVGLSENVVVGIAVDFDSSKIWVSSNGVWDEDPAFDKDDIPAASFLYPAISVQGRAAFIFGPNFKFAPPINKGSFTNWPGAPTGNVRIDCPRVGDSDILSIYKEAQIHGSVCFPKHVQRLVANTKYRDQPKTQRSWALTLSGAGDSFDGEYVREGVHCRKPLYKTSHGAVIFWNPSKNGWCCNSEGKFDSWNFWAPAGDSDYEPPRAGWEVLPEERGCVPVEIFKKVMNSGGVSDAIVEQIIKTLARPDTEGKIVVYRCTHDTSFQAELQKLTGDSEKDADAYWDKFVTEGQNAFLCDAGFRNASIVTTDHPYPPKSASFSRTVSFPGAEALSVYFASSSCTYDSDTTVEVKPLVVEAPPIGKRAMVSLLAGGSKKQSLESDEDDSDEDRASADDEETRSRGASNDEELPSQYGTIVEEVSKTLWKVKLDSKDNKEQFAICFDGSAELLDVVRYVTYPDGISASSEIGDLALDKSFPLTPVSVTNFKGPGPAQEAGARESMFVDLFGTLFGPSSSVIASLDGDGLGEAPKSIVDALDRIDQTFKRLQATLALPGVTIAFAEGCHADLVSERLACYPKDMKIHDELELAFDDDDGCLKVVSILKAGPAEAAGITVGWQVDLERTCGADNPGNAPPIAEEDVAENMNAFLELSDVTLVFDPPSSQNEDGSICCYGPRDEGNWTNGHSFSTDTLQFNFNTDGYGEESQQRWGFFALVVPTADEAISVEDVDKLVAGYMSIAQHIKGVEGTPTLEKQDWNEGRLRALCERFGWDFEWMAEDGERRRRIGERQQRLSKAQMKTVSSKAGSAGKPDGFRVL